MQHVKRLINKIFYYAARCLSKLSPSAVYNSRIHKTSKIESGCQIVNVAMNKHSFCGKDCKIVNAEVGSFCSIADGVVIGGARHPYEWVSTSPVFYKGRDSIKMKYVYHERPADSMTCIGNDVWVGERAMIKAGVSIGNGAVIGMGAIVTKDIPPYEIWAGNPAHRIKSRFPENEINKMVELKWWEWPDEKINRYAEFFTSTKKLFEELNK